MFEKVNPSHPDKVADRIAGALVDLAYTKQKDPKVAVEVLIGHGVCHIIAESSADFKDDEIEAIVQRIAGKLDIDFMCVPQDTHLAENQSGRMRCGDNGIFKGVPVTEEEKTLSQICRELYRAFPTDGKMILDGDRMIICQSNATEEEIEAQIDRPAEINPIGYWTGGTDVDTGATNRKLGSDMAGSVTGGGLHGKDLSKADVSVNIYAWLTAQAKEETVTYSCAIGDEYVNGVPYDLIVKTARKYINYIGGFERFAEWGLV